ncbi:hypothetical protein [Mesorhizobium sp. M0772]|uniref:hypothetical protein n=1 Tax=Mesorhizobium sp. M0772 TaxID=2956998 RepID=UPI0033360CA6
MAAEACRDLVDADSGTELAHALDTVAVMLDHLGKGRTSPLFEDLKTRVFRSGGDGNKKELDEITEAVAAYLLLCGNNQTTAAKQASSRCKHSAFSTVKKWLKGAEDAETLKSLTRWPDIERRIASAERRVTYMEFFVPATKVRNWDERVLDMLVSQANEIRAETASADGILSTEKRRVEVKGRSNGLV